MHFRPTPHQRIYHDLLTRSSTADLDPTTQSTHASAQELAARGQGPFDDHEKPFTSPEGKKKEPAVADPDLKLIINFIINMCLTTR